jgi:hypothetical protein
LPTPRPAHRERALQQLLVELALQLGHGRVQQQLLLLGQRNLDVRLDAPQQEGLQQRVELLHDARALLHHYQARVVAAVDRLQGLVPGGRTG